MPSSRLGKGMNAIFGQDVSAMLEDIQSGKSKVGVSAQIRLPLEQIRPNPYQPRKIFEPEALAELAQSISEHGVFQPILVKKSSVHGYELIAGERRLRASKLAGQSDIPAIIVDFDDQQMMEISLLENIQREDLNAIEEAKAYERLIQSMNYTQEQLAKRVGKSREHITNTLRLLKLPETVQQAVVEKKLSMGHARALIPLKDEKLIEQIANKAIAQGWSVRRMEQAVREALEAKARPEPVMEEDNLFVREASRQLEDFFQTPVKISSHSVNIHFENDADLTRILEKLSLIEQE